MVGISRGAKMPIAARLDREIPIEQVAEVVRRAADLYHVPEVAECRSVLVRLEGEWVNYATTLRVGIDWEDPAGDDVCAGGVRLLRWRIDPQDIKS